MQLKTPLLAVEAPCHNQKSALAPASCGQVALGKVAREEHLDLVTRCLHRMGAFLAPCTFLVAVDRKSTGRSECSDCNDSATCLDCIEVEASCSREKQLGSCVLSYRDRKV